MPKHDYECPNCHVVDERSVMIKDLDEPQECHICSTFMDRQFPLTAIYGFMPFDPEYDEVLGIDVNGRKEKRENLKAMGLEERGDRVGGARNEEKPSYMKRKIPPQGITLSDVQRSQAAAAEAKANRVLYAEHGTKAKRVRPRLNKAKMVHHISNAT